MGRTDREQTNTTNKDSSVLRAASRAPSSREEKAGGVNCWIRHTSREILDAEKRILDITSAHKREPEMVFQREFFGTGEFRWKGNDFAPTSYEEVMVLKGEDVPNPKIRELEKDLKIETSKLAAYTFLLRGFR
jgi:hypothetical protein